MTTESSVIADIAYSRGVRRGVIVATAGWFIILLVASVAFIAIAARYTPAAAHSPAIVCAESTVGGQVYANDCTSN